MIGLIATTLFLSHTFCFAQQDPSSLKCPEGIKSFSHGVQSDLYYVCKQENEHPLLMQCGPGTFYWPSKGTCHGTDNAANATYLDLVVTNRPALGNLILLGDLYNANTKEVLTGYSFWSSATILKYRRRKSLPSARVDIFSTKSTIDRLQRSHFTSEFQMDIIGDIVRVQGSAEYLKDRLQSEKEIAVALSYRAKTQTDTLPVATPKDEDFCAINGPTHVVTSVTYGIGANFLFKKTLKSNESADVVTQDLKYAINAIKTTKTDISDAVKHIVKDVRVNLFADFVSAKEPGTYEDSLRAYQSLPERVQQLNNTVTVEAKLIPITNFCKGKKVTHIAVSDDIVNCMSKMLGEIAKSKLKLDTIKMRKVARGYAPLTDILDTLLDGLTIFELRMKSDLNTLLPRIHRGEHGEEELISLLNRYTGSPFHYMNIKKFLNNRRREINMLRYILDPKKFVGTGIEVVNYEEGTDIETMFKKPYVLMLRYNVLPSIQLVRKFLNGETVDERESWFNSPSIISTMGVQFTKFVKFASSNTPSPTRGYLLAVADIQNKDIIEVMAQKEGRLDTFTFPDTPPIMTSPASTHQSVSFTVKRPTNTWVTAFSVSYWEHGRPGDVTRGKHEFSSSNITVFDVKGLKVNTGYQFEMRYVTPMGWSMPSDGSPFSTRPCSVPTNLSISVLGSDYFHIVWDSPSTCGKGLIITKYRVTVKGKDTFHRTIIVHGTRSVEVRRLHSASEYRVAIEAIDEGTTSNGTQSQDMSSSLPSSLSLRTRPDTPQYLSLHSRAIYSAVVVWMPPKRIATEAVIEKYLLKYVITNNVGSDVKRGTEMVVSTYNTSYHLTGLIQGTTYSVAVKVLTTLGDSEYSSPLKFKTTYNESELEMLRDALNHSVATIESEMAKKKDELEKKIDTNDARITSISHTPSLMVYYPRLRSDDFLVSRVTGCGGYINAPGELWYPSESNYRNNEYCTWNINTGLPTTLHFTSMSFECWADKVDVYDENHHIGQYCTGTPTVSTLSGNVYLKFKTDVSVVHTGFKVTISVSNTNRIEAQRYYADSRATFSGYGAPSSYSEHHTWNMARSNNSVPLCVQDCNNRYLKNNTWNEVSMELLHDPMQCTCYKNPVGFTYSFSQFHYRIPSS